MKKKIHQILGKHELCIDSCNFLSPKGMYNFIYLKSTQILDIMFTVSQVLSYVAYIATYIRNKIAVIILFNSLSWRFRFLQYSGS